MAGYVSLIMWPIAPQSTYIHRTEMRDRQTLKEKETGAKREREGGGERESGKEDRKRERNR